MSDQPTPIPAPPDAHNRRLAANVHPADWVNPTPAARYNLVVIGGGTAGLICAAGAAGLGAKVALVERHLLGGDCLNFGCVPSKSLLRAARAVADVRDAGRFGVHVPPGVTVDFPKIMERLRRVRADLSRHDSAARFRELGVDVFLGDAHFAGNDRIAVGGHELRFARAVIATGARATAPAIPGLAAAGFLTNETIFSLTELPRRLAVIGAGPIGCELAQAFRRFGAEVFLLHSGHRFLGREDRDAAAVVASAFRRDGVQLLEHANVTRVTARGSERVLHLDTARQTTPLAVDAILVGVGRAPNVENLGLEQSGVAFSASGVTVNDRLQTTNPRVFACGDVCLPFKFTHTADASARIVIQNALFAGRKKLSALTIPRCTYTDPELAHVGLTEHDADERGIAIRTFLHRFENVDRAVLDDETEGLVKIHVRAGTDEILGATVVARHAGEMISELTLAMVGGLGLRTIAETIHPYPTQAEAIRRAADAYQRTRLTPGVKKLLARWLAWTR